MLTASKLRDRITIQQLSGTTDALGQPEQTWADVCQVWAWPRNQNGASAIKAGADVSTLQTSIRIRWRTGINAGMRVLLGGTVYDIQAVLPDLERRDHVDLLCKQVT